MHLSRDFDFRVVFFVFLTFDFRVWFSLRNAHTFNLIFLDWLR